MAHRGDRRRRTARAKSKAQRTAAAKLKYFPQIARKHQAKKRVAEARDAAGYEGRRRAYKLGKRPSRSTATRRAVREGLARLSGTPEEHARLGKAALREVMRLEGKVRTATQAGDCAGATRASHDLFFAMGQADAHGELTNAAFARLQNMGRASVSNACGLGGLAGFKKRRR